MFINPDETYPSKGRILLFEIQQGAIPTIVLRHIENVNGSVQALATVFDDSRYLVAGINNRVSAFKLDIKQGPTFQLTEIEHMDRGNCITEIKVAGDGGTIFVGDMMRSISVIDLRERNRGLQTHVRL